MKNYDNIIEKLTIEDMVGQLLCYDVYDKDDEEEVLEIIRKIHPGGIFTGSAIEKETIKKYVAEANACTKVPTIVTSDIIDGPGDKIKGDLIFSSEAGRTATGDIYLVEQAGRITAERSRKYGYHWTFGPCVDIGNPKSPISNIGVHSDNADAVIKYARAFIRGMMSKGYLMPTLKHFPGDGTDDRNPHFCTTINRLSKDEWYKTYGKIYKELIKEGAPAVMAAHVSLPWAEDCENPNDALPGTLSKNVLTGILKGELGFNGCIVSDAMSMIGAASRVPLDRLAIEFIKAGGDMILFPEPTDYELLIEAVNSGEITTERLKDAVRRILYLKDRARLFKNQEDVNAEIVSNDEEDKKIADEIAEKSIKIVVDKNKILPLSLKTDARILMCNLIDLHFNKPPVGNEFLPMKQEFEKRGFTVDYFDNIKHKKIQEIMNSYDAIFVNSIIHPGNYHGGTLRVGWNVIMTFWRGYILKHRKLVFTSFGDPYKLYDFPYLNTYVNAFSDSPETQRAAVKILLGEKQMTAKNPVSLDGFFKREV